jgi:UDP-N-acetylglucosamine 2-epimerase (non-hydrolysing)
MTTGHPERVDARPMTKILTLFGTRPEIIKLAPVIWQLESDGARFRTLNIASGQHSTLLTPFIRLFDIRIDHDLRIMQPGQDPSSVCARLLTALDPILVREAPSFVLVQGDTTTAMAGALAAFHRNIPVGHVEAGLRTGNARSPFPEEMNRRLIGRLASYHFAATPGNRATLIREGIDEHRIFVTGNPVVDVLNAVLARRRDPSANAGRLLAVTEGLKRIVLTTHRRESFGWYMTENLKTLVRFVDAHADTALLFPVHPNPTVVRTTAAVIRCHPRIHLFEPMAYDEFLVVLSHAWLIVSDSGGVQEEAPSLGRPLLILRENTERPEAVRCGIARLLGPRPERLMALLEEAHTAGSWVDRAGTMPNPFGMGDAAKRIVDVIAAHAGESFARTGT